MEKYRGDEIVSSGKFVSYLKYTCTNSQNQQLLSPLCGMGWKLMMYTGSGSSTLEFRFFPDFLYNVPLGNLTVEFIVVSARKDSGLDMRREPTTTTVSLPSGSAYYNCQVYGSQYNDTSRFLALHNLAQASQWEVFVQLSVKIPAINVSPGRTIPADYTTVRIKSMLSSMLSGAEVTDAKFFLLSRTSPATGPYGPRGLWVNAGLLRGRSDELDEMLFGDSFQAETQDLDAPYSENRIPNLDSDNHDFPEDSDLEEDELDHWEEEMDRKGKGKLVLESSETENTHNSPASASGAPCDSSTESSASASRINGSGNAEVSSKTTPAKMPKRVGRAICIQGHAYRTWQAFVFYLMTGEVTFLPLTSSGKRATVQQRLDEEGTIACSPKSMYHLAEKFGVPELSRLSLEDLEKGISEKNAVEEAFSRFFGLYPALTHLVSGYITTHMTPNLAFKFDEALKSIIPKTNFDVVSLTFQKMHKLPLEDEKEDRRLPAIGSSIDPFETMGEQERTGKKLKKKKGGR
ncbi:hypothetical protein BKA70DRAFT_656881 [Coprinopsis sp. MPI-PUGE-AT-0042]|nr:hypothetical protein BKA70DRAFT_656881 [Coprinopsis sp. MPI-PUGE-AT-0042]